jgi:hypothetical protein
MIANCEATTTATVAIASQTTIMHSKTRQNGHNPEQQDHRTPPFDQPRRRAQWGSGAKKPPRPPLPRGTQFDQGTRTMIAIGEAATTVTVALASQRAILVHTS